MKSVFNTQITDLKVFRATTEKYQMRDVAPRGFFSLSYRISGEVTIFDSENGYTSSHDSITFVPRGVPYSTEIKECSDMIFVHFYLDGDVDIRSISVMPADAETKRLFFELLKKYKPTRRHMLECISTFYAILARLERQSGAFETCPKCVVSAKRILDEQYADASISVSAVAEAVGVSDSYLRRTFKKAYGIGPGEHLSRVRIRNAKNLLETELFSVSEIAKLCGFSSVGYFIQSFRHITGVSPGRYRERF